MIAVDGIEPSLIGYEPTILTIRLHRYVLMTGQILSGIQLQTCWV